MRAARVFIYVFIYAASHLVLATQVFAVGLPVGPGGRKAPYDEIVRFLRDCGFQRVEDSDEDSFLTLGELRVGQEKWRKAIKSLRVQFTYTFHRKYESTRDATNKKTGWLLKDGYRSEVDFAMKGAKRFKTVSTFRPSDSKKVQALSKPHYTDVFNGKEMRSYQPHTFSGNISERKQAHFEDSAVLYFEAISMPVGVLMEQSAKTSWYLPNALKWPQFYRVLPKQEIVDGCPCHVVTCGWDTFWIDPRHGFAMRRRVEFRRIGALDPGVLQDVWICGDFVELDDGVWLPTHCRRLDYATQGEPAGNRGKLLAVNEIIAKPEVNNVADSLFDLEFPAGTLVADMRKKVAYYMPEGKELLEEAIAKAKPIINNRVHGTPGRPAPKARKKTYVILTLNGLLICLLAVAWLVYHVRSRKKSAQRDSAD